ncbi:ATP-dependent DNA helicase [Roseburia hominis]
MEQETPVIRISVRNLVEFILREGDIDNRTGGSMDKEAMQLGSKIHRKIQRRMGAEYRAEVPLKTEISCEGFILRVEGRADGIIEREDEVLVDEIKGVLCELEKIEEPVGVHLAQAKCYACIYASQHSLSRIGVQMTYCQMESEEIKQFRQDFSIEELQEWFEALVRQYEKWARFQVEWREERNASIKKLEFPFAYRKGQKELVSSVYRTILRKKKLFIQAPTGVGKTISGVFPAVKAVGEELGEKIFYLTAKTITRTVAEQAFDKLKEQELRLKVITITAKEKICFMEETECNPENCPYAKGHYDRVNDAVFELLNARDDMNREALEEQARKHQVCPFEMALDVSTWVDAVICDYNYVFDPNAHLKRFFSDGVQGEYLFLIDEAHNLVERGRQMYSASLIKEDFLAVRRLVKGQDTRLAKRLEECNKQLLELKRECENYQVINSVSHMYLKLMNVMAEMERFLEICEGKEIREQVLELYFNIRAFLGIYDRLDENYVIYTELLEDGRFMLKLFCVNPAANLQEFLDMGNSAVFFSATLLPIQYYKKLLSTESDNYAIYADSTFDRRKRLLLNGVDVSTKYTLRSEQMYRKYALYIQNAVRARKGNYIAFFPSYRFMEQVYEAYEELDTGTECILQSHFMNEEAREIFLETFEEEREESLVGFCVLGGIFSEGIDLAKEKLIGAFIIGTGLPQVCNEREILKQYFDKAGMQGFDYAYLYPGMNKVLQAAGRVIRTEEDEGVILLLDERFRERRCRETFPREWSDCQMCRIGDVEQQVRAFWDGRE